MRENSVEREGERGPAGRQIRVLTCHKGSKNMKKLHFCTYVKTPSWHAVVEFRPVVVWISEFRPCRKYGIYRIPFLKSKAFRASHWDRYQESRRSTRNLIWVLHAIDFTFKLRLCSKTLFGPPFFWEFSGREFKFMKKKKKTTNSDNTGKTF